MIAKINECEGVCIDGKWKGWVFSKHPDGKWISVRKLELVNPFEGNPLAFLFNVATNPTPAPSSGGGDQPVGTSEFAQMMKAYETFVADLAPNLHWKVWYASGSYEGGFDGYRHGFGMHQLGPAPLPELMEQMRQALRAALSATRRVKPHARTEGVTPNHDKQVR